MVGGEHGDDDIILLHGTFLCMVRHSLSAAPARAGGSETTQGASTAGYALARSSNAARAATRSRACMEARRQAGLQRRRRRAAPPSTTGACSPPTRMVIGSPEVSVTCERPRGPVDAHHQWRPCHCTLKPRVAQPSGTCGCRAHACRLHGQPGEAQHRDHPQAAQGRDMHAAVDRRMGVGKVGRRRLAEVTHRHVGRPSRAATTPCRARAERAAVAATRLVIAEISRRASPANSSGSKARSATTSACLMTCANWVRSRPSTTSIGTVRPA